MKKLFALALSLCLAVGLVACTNNADPENKPDNPAQTTGPASPGINASKINTVNEYMEALGDKLVIAQVSQKAASMVGALEGVGFFVDDLSFELYLFDNLEALSEAKSGSYVLNIQGFAPITMLSSVNGNFVLLYDVENADVINVFASIEA